MIILSFEQRVQDARNKLSELPKGLLPLKEHKKREKIRRELESEIEHVKTLIVYAKEALVDV